MSVNNAPMDDGDMRNVYLTPEEAASKYQQIIEFLDTFYKNEFDPVKYIPITKDGIEAKLNNLQFAINYVHSFPDISSQYRASMTVWCIQAAFWIGYLEGKSTETIQLPPGFYEALGE